MMLKIQMANGVISLKIGINGATVLRSHMFLARLDARYQLLPNHYVSLMSNASYDFDSFSTFRDGRPLFGVGVGYGFNTIAGPLKAHLFWSSLTRKVGVYLSFGYSF